MDEIEKELERLDFTQPPPWAKARSLLAAENVFRRQARKSRMKCIAVAAVAASVSVIIVGTYIANAIAPILGRSGPGFPYPPPEAVERMGPLQPDLIPPPDRPPGETGKMPPEETERKEKDEDEKKDEKKEAEDGAADKTGGGER